MDSRLPQFSAEQLAVKGAIVAKDPSKEAR